MYFAITKLSCQTIIFDKFKVKYLTLEDVDDKLSGSDQGLALLAASRLDES